MFFNDNPVKEVDDTKHLGMILDSKLNFDEHMKDKLAKARRSLGVMKQMKKWIGTRFFLITQMLTCYLASYFST